MIQNEKNLLSRRYKILICGSGPAGLSLALELEKNKIECLIVEAGDEFYSEKAQNRYNGEIIGNFPDNLSISRLSQFGGTTGHWGGTCRTLDGYDFKEWPITKDDLEPYLKDSCNILEIPNSFREKKIAKNLKIIEFQESDVRFHDKYYKHVSNSKYIDVCLNSVINNIKIENNIIQEISIKSNTTFSIKADFLILACGGIENSRMLLWFRENNKSISRKLPIGNYWMEHPFKKIGSGVGNFKAIRKSFKNSFESFKNFRNWGNYTVSLSPTQNLINKKNILNAGVFLTLHDRNNDGFKNNLKDLLCVAPSLSKNVLDLFNKNLLCGITLSSSWEQNPQLENKITLSSSKDFSGIPFIKLNYQLSDQTLRTAKEMVNQIGNYFIDQDLGRLGADETIDNSSSFLSDAGYHHIGGTIMGNNLNNSVVDKNLKLHDIKNLYICGSSVFPTGGHANPTLSIVQLSLRLGEHLTKKLKTI